jgi:IS30 family transposase
MTSIYGPMTPSRKETIWSQWRKGIPMITISREIKKPPATVYSYLLYHGGIEPTARVRRKGSLNFCERETISRHLAQQTSIRAIARELGRCASTVSREVNRNGGETRYRAELAEKAFIKKAKRPKAPMLATNAKLCKLVASKLEQDWSPEQISGWLKLTHPNQKEMYVSHETIYKTLYIQTRGVLREQLKKHLRTKRMFRHAKNHHAAVNNDIPAAISIRDRPVEIDTREVPGHWEGDLIIGSNHSAIATVVERQSRFTVLCKVKGKDTAGVVASLTKQMSKLPEHVLKSLTWDRGREMCGHQQFTIATKMNVYFCDPSSPWQRGTNENTNGLLRQYFPKQTSLSNFNQLELNKVALKLNSRPRKTLGYKTPAQVLNEVLH